jgi:hypothetical protein
MASLKGVTLQLLIGPGIPTLAKKSVIDALDTVQTTSAVGSKSGFQLAFRFSKTSEIARSLLPGGYFDPLTRVIVCATVNGVTQVLADGPILRQDLVAATEPGTARLTVTGEDLSAYMDLVDLTGVPFPAMPVVAQVALILARYASFGIVPLVIPPISEDLRSPTTGWKTQQGTDLAYIEQQAKSAGYVFCVQPGPKPGMSTAYFGPPVRVGAPQSALSIDFDRATNVEGLSFSFDANNAILPFTFMRIPIAKVEIPVPVPDIGLLKPPLAARPFVPAKIRRMENGRFGAADVVKHLLAGRGGPDPVNGSGTLNVGVYGTALTSGSLVGVRGAGLAYDGMWFVKSVSNTLSRGSWKQSFQIARDGLVSQTQTVPI